MPEPIVMTAAEFLRLFPRPRRRAPRRVWPEAWAKSAATLTLDRAGVRPEEVERLASRDADAAQAEEDARWRSAFLSPRRPSADRPDKEAVRDACDMAALLESLGMRPRRVGSRLVASCPFHADVRPSFSADAGRKLWHCFSCGRGGDAFSLVMAVNGCPFPEAVEWVGGTS